MDWETLVPGCIDKSTPGTEVATLQCIPAVFQVIVTAALTFVGAAAVIMIIYAGIRFITSRGDPKQVQGAKQIMTWAIIGLIIVLISFGIIALISTITGTTCINTFGFGNCS